MNTAELVQQVAGRTGMNQEGVKKVLDATFAAIADAAQAGEPVAVSGFGQFKIQDRAARQGRNPATGESMDIPASRKLAFVAAKQVRDRLTPA